MRESSIPVARGAKGDIVGVFGGKARLPRRADQTEATKNLHRARRTWLHLALGGSPPARVSATVTSMAALCEIDRQRQPNRSPADDKHFSIDSTPHESTARSATILGEIYELPLRFSLPIKPSGLPHQGVTL